MGQGRKAKGRDLGEIGNRQMVKVKLYGIAREIAGKEELDINFEGPISLKTLIKGISRDNRDILSKDVMVILVNGRSCIFMEGLDTQIKDGDFVEVLPLLKGG